MSVLVRFGMVLVVVSALPFSASAQATVSGVVARPSAWAVPLEKPGLPNLIDFIQTLDVDAVWAEGGVRAP